MASAGSIRSFKSHVEMGGDLGPLTQALNQAKKQVQDWGKGLMGIGANMAATGMAMVGMLTPGIMAFATYEQSLADLKAAGNPTAEQFERVKTQIEAVSRSTGTDLNETTDAFRQLLFAGVDLETVLSGVGETTIKFARVGLMPAGQAALVVADALNVFSREGITAARASDLITQAASASSISVEQVAQSFSAGGGAMGQFNQTMLDTTTAIGVMGQQMVKGATAGTALKTLMTRLATGMSTEAGDGAGEAGEAMATMGLNVRDAAGNMLPMIDIIGRIKESLARFSKPEQDVLLKKLGGMKGMTALLALLKGGVEGWNKFQGEMLGSMTVEERFDVMTNTLLGQLKRLWVEISLVAVAIGEALAPALKYAMNLAMPVLSFIGDFLNANKELIQGFAFDATKAVVFGAALIGLGAILYGSSLAIGMLVTVMTPLYSAVAFAATGFGILSLATMVWSGITAAAGAVAATFAAIGTGLAFVWSILTGAIWSTTAGLAVWNFVAGVASAIGTVLSAVWLSFTTTIWLSAAAQSVWATIMGIATAVMLPFQIALALVALGMGIMTGVVTLAGVAQGGYGAMTTVAVFLTAAWAKIVAVATVVGAFFKTVLALIVVGIALMTGTMTLATLGLGGYTAATGAATIGTTLATGGINLLIGALVILAAALAAFAAWPLIVGLWGAIKASAITAAEAATKAWTDVSTIVADTFGKTVASASTLFAGLKETLFASLPGFLDAFKSQDWGLVWELFKVSAQLAWHDISVFVSDTFLTWKFALTEIFYGLGDILRVMFADILLNFRIGILEATGSMPGLRGASERRIAGLRQENEERTEALNVGRENRQRISPVREAWERRLAEEVDQRKRAEIEEFLAALEILPTAEQGDMFQQRFFSGVEAADIALANRLGVIPTALGQSSAVNLANLARSAEEPTGEGPTARNRAEQRTQLQAQLAGLVGRAAEPYQFLRDILKEYAQLDSQFSDMVNMGMLSAEEAMIEISERRDQLEEMALHEGRNIRPPEPVRPQEFHPDAEIAAAIKDGAFGSFSGAAISGYSGGISPAERTARAAEDTNKRMQDFLDEQVRIREALEEIMNAEVGMPAV